MEFFNILSMDEYIIIDIDFIRKINKKMSIIKRYGY